ncbi:MAG: SEL1-like repeat protein, partial [Rhodomicrobium sp.]|nr:SEL1-like repeat protein [Rhodomicrobium sp.]
MAGKGNAKAGRSSIGNHDLDTAWESRAGEAMRERVPDAERLAESRQPQSRLFGQGETDAEAELCAHLDRAKAPRPSGFPPLDELSARLGEFGPPSPAAFTEPEQQEGTQEPFVPASSEAYRRDLDWFDERFSELRGLVTRKDDDKRELVAINGKLAEIAERVDRLSAAMPGEKMAAVETQLAELTRSLYKSRQQSAEDADRISRAAGEILAATVRAEAARAGFERAANHTVEELGQTVVVTASRTAVVTAERITAAMRRTGEQSDVARLESQLRALNAQSRESGERTEAALERVHHTLRAFLERGHTSREGNSPPPHKKRAGIHMPISAEAPVYTRAGTGFGAGLAQKPKLDTITHRTPKPLDPNFFKALNEAGANTAAGRFRDAGGGIPAPKGQIATLAPVRSRLPETAQPPASTAQIPPEQPSPGYYQALLTAADQSRPPLASQPESLVEDLKILESAARQGDRDAQFRIGVRFLNDASLEGGASAAARWFAKAAGQGHTEAQFILASLCERGAGVPKDENHAMDLYRNAASAGHIRAMHNLGVLLTARGTPEDYKEAALWFGRAASSGLTDSQYNLALLYERGLGLERDPAKAYLWYEKAAQSGDKQAIQHAG